MDGLRSILAWKLRFPALAHLFFNQNIFFQNHCCEILQLWAMDVSAQATMKDAAKCDKRCEWQNSANQENVERILHF